MGDVALAGLAEVDLAGSMDGVAVPPKVGMAGGVVLIGPVVGDFPPAGVGVAWRTLLVPLAGTEHIAARALPQPLSFQDPTGLPDAGR